MAEGPAAGTLEATALILAAGSGQRLGAGGPKALVPVAGRPMFEWSVDACRESNSIGENRVTSPPGMPGDFATLPVRWVTGGETRSHSVANALEGVDTDIVLVHDAARPLVTSELIEACIAELVARPEVDCVIAAAYVTDTIKSVGPDGVVTDTIDRDILRAVQTPQVFRTEALRRAVAGGDLAAATDDASLIEAAGGKVAVFHWRRPNDKITTPEDLELVEHLLSVRNRQNG